MSVYNANEKLLSWKTIKMKRCFEMEMEINQNENVKMMKKRDYFADMSGTIAMNLAANLTGQLTYFYTDKVGLTVAGVGLVMMICKVLESVTTLWFGNVIDQSKGGSRKYYTWLARYMVPYAISVGLLFCVPIQAGQIPALIFACVTNLLLSGIFGTLIGTPLSAVMIVRTNNQSERENMGVFRAAGTYGSGVFIAIATIPLTNVLGGTQLAWIKYGFIVSLMILLLFAICYRNGKNAKLVDEVDSSELSNEVEKEEEVVKFKDAMKMLLKNKYWIILLLFNVLTQITNSMAVISGTYYTKWIFGNDNLVAVAGGFGMIATAIGFMISKPVIGKLGIKNTINLGIWGVILTAAIRCVVPTNFVVYIATGLVGNFLQIPMMCLYGVLLAMVIDYNEYKFNSKMVGVSSGAIGIGTKIGAGLGSVILSTCLALGAYDPSLAVATVPMRYSIYAFSNYLPIVINLILIVIVSRFDLESKLPQIQTELAQRRAKN